jgi:hypothetical protein
MKIRISTLFLLLAALIVVAPRASAQGPAPYLTVGCWNFNGNGHQGPLCITSIVGGVVKGTLFLTDPIEGFWNATTGELSFIRNVAGNPSRDAQQVYVGFWFPDNSNVPAGLKRLAGSFYASGAAAGGFPARHVVGWTAIRFY